MKTTTTLGTLSNSIDSIFPVWEIEDQLVSGAWNKGEPALPILVALTTLALHRYDAACQEYARRSIVPYIWPILEEERRELRAFRQRHPVGVDELKMAERLLNDLLADATIDEVATGAFNALRGIARSANAALPS